jgi:hypothetical protein
LWERLFTKSAHIRDQITENQFFSHALIEQLVRNVCAMLAGFAFCKEKTALPSNLIFNPPGRDNLKSNRTMKTIISSILIIAVAFLLHGCRPQDEEEILDKEIQINNEIYTATYQRSDSTKTIADSISPKGGTVKTDPPPKDRDQWKIKSD